jgi:seryl-tRNA synthetase
LQVLQREMQAEAQRLQAELNTRKIERKSRQEKFDQLQMSLQMISAESTPSTATEVCAVMLTCTSLHLTAAGHGFTY